MKKSLYMIKLP